MDTPANFPSDEAELRWYRRYHRNLYRNVHMEAVKLGILEEFIQDGGSWIRPTELGRSELAALLQNHDLKRVKCLLDLSIFSMVEDELTPEHRRIARDYLKAQNDTGGGGTF